MADVAAEKPEDNDEDAAIAARRVEVSCGVFIRKIGKAMKSDGKRLVLLPLFAAAMSVNPWFWSGR